jgi:alanyl-tRNA synthetase
MQNHTGEHIVSGLIHERFGYENVGFHMSSDRMTIDLSGALTEEEIREIERRANEIVWSDVPVYTDLYTEEEAENVEFRSKKELHGTIRVVRIPGADVCACCGTHVLRTGEIGSIRIISHVRFKGGVRMELMCGRWAYNYMTGIFIQNHEVSMALSAKMNETGSAAQKLLQEDAALKFRITQLLYSVIDRKARELRGTGDVLLFAEDFSPLLVQKLTAKVMEECGGSCFSFSGTDDAGYRYAAGESGGDLKELVRKMNQELNGRGGGKPFFLQGSVSASREAIENFLSGKKEGLQIIDL